MREGCRFVADRAREVAVEVGDRFLDAANCPAPGDRLVHPGSAALGVARVEVEIELADEFACRRLYAEEAHVVIPDRCAVRFQADAEQRLDNMEEAGHYFRFGKVLLHFLFGEGVARLQQFLRSVADIPWLKRFQPEFVARKLAQFGNVLLCKGLGLDGQIAQEGEHLRHRFGHLGNQGYFGVVVVAEQLGLFATQFENAPNERCVVEFGRAEFSRARGVGTIHRRTQPAAVGVLHDRQVGRHMQCEFPAGFALFVCRFTGRLSDVVGQSGEFGLVADDFGKGVGGVEQVFRELGRKAGQFF